MYEFLENFDIGIGMGESVDTINIAIGYVEKSSKNRHA